MVNWLNKNRIQDRLFDVTWIILIIVSMLRLSAWILYDTSLKFETTLLTIEYGLCGLCIVIIILNFICRKYPWKVVICYAIMAIAVFLPAYFADNKYMVVLWLVFGAAYGQNSRRLITISFFITAIMSVLLVAFSLIGIAPNPEWHRYRDGLTLIRYGLGFHYTSTGPTVFFGIILQYIYLRKEKLRFFEPLILEAINLFLYWKTDARMPFYLGTVVLVFFLIESLFKNHWRFTAKLKGLLVVAPALIGLISVAGYIFYDGSKPFWQKVNTLLTERLALGDAAVQTYGINLYGHDIAWNGSGVVPTDAAYNFVDCSYMRLLLSYGALFLAVVLAIYVIANIKAVKIGDHWLSLLMICAALYGVTEPYLVDFAATPLIITAVAYCEREALTYRKRWLADIFKPSSSLQ